MESSWHLLPHTLRRQWGKQATMGINRIFIFERYGLSVTLLALLMTCSQVKQRVNKKYNISVFVFRLLCWQVTYRGRSPSSYSYYRLVESRAYWRLHIRTVGLLIWKINYFRNTCGLMRKLLNDHDSILNSNYICSVGIYFLHGGKNDSERPTFLQ